MNFFKDINPEVVYSIVVCPVEMARYIIVLIFGFHHLKMSLESVNNAIHSLTYILFPACFAFNAVYEIATFASPIFLAGVGPLGIMTGDVTTVVDDWAIIALLSHAFVATYAVGFSPVLDSIVLSWNFGRDK